MVKSYFAQRMLLAAMSNRGGIRESMFVSQGRRVRDENIINNASLAEMELLRRTLIDSYYEGKGMRNHVGFIEFAINA